jgi:rhodanese-related sulfurtransferase
MIKNIKTYELQNLIKNEDVLLIDAREKIEYKKKKIKNAINLEVEDVDKILTICPDKNKKVVVIFLE